MPKWSIRDLWGKHTEKKTLNPEMRNMLMSLDGVYEPKDTVDPQPKADREQHDDAARKTAP
jgi:hypothetical protein